MTDHTQTNPNTAHSVEGENSKIGSIVGIVVSSTTVLYAFAIIVIYVQLRGYLSLLNVEIKSLVSLNDLTLNAIEVFGLTFLKLGAWPFLLSGGLLTFLLWKGPIKRFVVVRFPHFHRRLIWGLACTLLGLFANAYVLAAREFFDAASLEKQLGLLVQPKICSAQDQDFQVIMWRGSESIVVACPETTDLVVLSRGENVTYSLWPLGRSDFDGKAFARKIRRMRDIRAISGTPLSNEFAEIRTEFNRRNALVDTKTGELSEASFGECL
jgi:hypothetical protein